MKGGKMFRYVKLGEDGFPISEYWVSEKIQDTDMIEVPSEFNLTNQRYINGGWVDVSPPDPMVDAISEEEERQLEMQMNIEYLIMLTEMNMEV